MGNLLAPWVAWWTAGVWVSGWREDFLVSHKTYTASHSVMCHPSPAISFSADQELAGPAVYLIWKKIIKGQVKSHPIFWFWIINLVVKIYI